MRQTGIIILLLLLFTASCVQKYPAEEPPVAVNGVIDLKDWDFTRNGPVVLDGEWKFVWLETDPSFSKAGYDDSEWEKFTIPDFWNKKVNARYGYAWFRLKIINMKSEQQLALYLVNSLVEYELYCNGKLILSNGRTGKTRNESRSQRIPLWVPLEGNKEFVLSWKISNFIHANGGPGYSPVIGIYNNIKNEMLLKNCLNFLLFGIIVMMGIYHLFLWLFIKEDKASLYFSLFCFLVLVRVFTVYRYIDQIFAFSYIYAFTYRLELLAIPVGLVVFLFFFREIFPSEFSRVLFTVFLILSGILFTLEIFIPIWICSNLVFVYNIILFLSAVWVIYMCILALVRKRPGSVTMFLGFLFMFLALTSDILASYLPGINISSIHIGFTVFIFCQSHIITRRFASAYRTANYLSKNLQHEVKEQTRIISEKNEELIRLYREKTDYFINLSHEIKTPLTLIKNYLDKYIEEKGINENLSVIKANFEKLKTDIINFLDYEKLAKGQVFYDHNLVSDFSHILKTKIPLYSEYAKNKNLAFTSSLEDNILIKADPCALERIVNNIIDNAIKYTKEGGEIAVLLEKQNGNIVFRVTDTGLGISEEQKAHIFTPYYQVSHKKRNIQGIGMGLNIVNNIVREIKGEIRIESKEDEGTAFTIIFKSHTARKDDVIYRDTGLDIIPWKTTNGKLKNEKIIKGRHTLFIVDDNIDMLAFLQDSLEDTYNVFYALNGEDALRKIDRIPLPDIIISDIMMDPMDGYEFHEQLVMKVEYSFVPFIFLTARTSRQEKLKGIKQGAVDFICKPFDIMELKVKIESLIKLQEARKIRSELEVEERILHAIRNRKSKDEKFYRIENSCMNFGITERERDVILLLLEGKEDKEISSELNLSYHTVRTHIRHIYSKCSVQNKVELANLFKNV